MEETPENKIANGPPRNRHERRERETKAKHKARADARREKRRATKATWEMRDALEAMDGVVTLPEGAPVEFLTVKEDPQFLAISFVKDPPDPRCRITSVTTTMPADMTQDAEGRITVRSDP